MTFAPAVHYRSTRSATDVAFAAVYHQRQAARLAADAMMARDEGQMKLSAICQTSAAFEYMIARVLLGIED